MWAWQVGLVFVSTSVTVQPVLLLTVTVLVQHGIARATMMPTDRCLVFVRKGRSEKLHHTTRASSCARTTGDDSPPTVTGRLPYPFGSPTRTGGGSPWHGPCGSGFQRSPPRRSRCDLTREWYEQRYHIRKLFTLSTDSLTGIEGRMSREKQLRPGSPPERVCCNPCRGPVSDLCRLLQNSYGRGCRLPIGLEGTSLFSRLSGVALLFWTF